SALPSFPTRRSSDLVIVKDGGLPAVTALWREISIAEAAKRNVEALFMNVDLAAYEFIRNPAQFDVVLTPNLFGDILVDITGAVRSEEHTSELQSLRH